MHTTYYLVHARTPLSHMCMCTSHLYIMKSVVHLSTLYIPYYLQMCHVNVQRCTFHFRSLYSVFLLWTKIFTTPRLPLSRLDPTSVVGHPLRLLRLHACSVVLERPCACLLLSPVRTFSRRHASVSDSRVGLLLLSILFTSRHRPLLKVSRRL